MRLVLGDSELVSSEFEKKVQRCLLLGVALSDIRISDKLGDLDVVFSRPQYTGDDFSGGLYRIHNNSKDEIKVYDCLPEDELSVASKGDISICDNTKAGLLWCHHINMLAPFIGYKLEASEGDYVIDIKYTGENFLYEIMVLLYRLKGKSVVVRYNNEDYDITYDVGSTIKVCILHICDYLLIVTYNMFDGGRVTVEGNVYELYRRIVEKYNDYIRYLMCGTLDEVGFHINIYMNNQVDLEITNGNEQILLRFDKNGNVICIE